MKLQTLKQKSVKVGAKVKVIWPSRGMKIETFDLSANLLHPKQFSVKKQTICFVDEDGIYVTPYTSAVLSTLFNEAFERSECIYVPFVAGDMPYGEQKKWRCLQEAARFERAKERASIPVNFQM